MNILKTPPGFMTYYKTVRPFLNRMSDEQAGRLYKALLDYAENGEIVDFDDPLTGAVFDSLRASIDRDAGKYDEACAKKRYASWCAQQRKTYKDTEPLPFDEWQRLVDKQT